MTLRLDRHHGPARNPKVDCEPYKIPSTAKLRVAVTPLLSELLVIKTQFSGESGGRWRTGLDAEESSDGAHNRKVPAEQLQTATSDSDCSITTRVPPALTVVRFVG